MITAPSNVGRSPRGLFPLGIFFIFGACMAALAGATLLFTGTVLDRAWALNPSAYKQLYPVRLLMGPLFLVLSSTLLTAAVGWFQRRVWAWRLGVAVMCLQVLGDVVNVLRGEILAGGTGVVIAAALLFYLLRPGVRAAFH